MMVMLVLLQILSFLGLTLAHITTSPALLPRHVYPEDRGIFANLRDHRLWKRNDQCDQSQFFCPTGTCFTDPANGYVGCCSVSSCAPRTSCIEYNPTISKPCDPDTGGCLYCSNRDNPHCLKITNLGANQWIQYCATIASTETLSYANFITTGSQWSASSTSTSTTTSSSSSIPSSTSQTVTTASNSASSTFSSSTDVTAASVASNSTVTSGASQMPTASMTLSGGAIGGVVTGAVFALSAVGAGIWLLRKRSSGGKKYPTTGEKQQQAPLTPPSGTKEDPAEAEGSTPKEPTQYFSPNGFSQYHEADSQAVSMSPHPAVRLAPSGLGINPEQQQSPKRVSRYTISNPDAQSATDGSSHFVSPIISQQGDSPPTGAQSTMPKTPTAGRYYQNNQYTPSLYAADPPGSIPHTTTGGPPSLPQPYSLAAIPADCPASDRPERRSGLYRGLSSRAGEPTPPWAYLSPENAVNGGWVNGSDKTT